MQEEKADAIRLSKEVTNMHLHKLSDKVKNCPGMTRGMWQSSLCQLPRSQSQISWVLLIIFLMLQIVFATRKFVPFCDMQSEREFSSTTAIDTDARRLTEEVKSTQAGEIQRMIKTCLTTNMVQWAPWPTWLWRRNIVSDMLTTNINNSCILFTCTCHMSFLKYRGFRIVKTEPVETSHYKYGVMSSCQFNGRSHQHIGVVKL